ncbi:unnamed protein product, partial [marine sediment metagenome]
CYEKIEEAIPKDGQGYYGGIGRRKEVRLTLSIET